MLRAALLLGFLVTTALHPCSSFAFEMGKLQINGFVSQGYMESDNNSFLDPTSQEGTFQISEIGLTFNIPVTEKLRIGAQLLSSDLGQDGNNEVTLDWAYGDYRMTDWLGLRAGKIKLPVGMYNETRDSDFLRTMAFLPQSVYDEMQRSFMVAGLGVGIYGNVPAGGFGDFDYQFFYGQLQIDENTLLIDTGLTQGMDSIVGGVASAFGATANVSDLTYQPDYTFVASFIYNSSLDGLRLGASYMTAQGIFDVEINDPFGVFNGIVSDFNIDANYEYMYVLSAEYVLPLVTLQIEYMQRETDVKASGLAPLSAFIGNQYNFLTETNEGMYAMATFQVPQVPGLSLTALYDEFYLDKDDHSNANNYRKDLALGARYDINPNWLVKVEWHDIEGTALNLGMVNEGSMTDDWSYFIVKTSFNF